MRDLPESIRRLVEHLISSGVLARLVLFGSRARGDARDNSDYDLAAWTNDRAEWSKLVVRLSEQPLTLLPVDLVLYDELSSEYQRRIDREGKVLYDAE